MTVTSLRNLLDADWNRLLEVSGEPLRRRKWRHAFSPRFASVTLVRVAQRLEARSWRRLAKLASLANFVMFGIEVPTRLSIGPGLVLPHTQGTILGAASIGANVTLFQQVTLGARTADFSFDPAKRPRVMDGAVISAGAKVLGPVLIGERVVVGANAVVLIDVPADCLAVGVPARVIRRDDPAATESVA